MLTFTIDPADEEAGVCHFCKKPLQAADSMQTAHLDCIRIACEKDREENPGRPSGIVFSIAEGSEAWVDEDQLKADGVKVIKTQKKTH